MATPAKELKIAAYKLGAARVAKRNQKFPSKEIDAELERAEKVYEALLGRRIEGVGGRFGRATPPKDFEGEVGSAPESLAEAKKAEIADILGSRAFTGTQTLARELEPGRARVEALQEQIAQRKREQEAFALQQGTSGRKQEKPFVPPEEPLVLAPKEEPKEEPTVREQTQGAVNKALNNAGKEARRKAYEAAGIF